MFLGGFQESSFKSVPMNTISSECLVALLEYIYLDQLFSEISVIVQMMGWGDLFFVSAMKEKCEEWILSNGLEGESAIEVLKVAKLQGCKSLSKYCLRLIAKDFHRLCTTKSFESLNPTLQQKVLEFTNSDQRHVKITFNNKKLKTQKRHSRYHNVNKMK